MHGMAKNKLEFSNSNSNWPSIFEKEKERLDKQFGSKSFKIEHIGSTAVQGLLAKPIIDIAIVFITPNDLWYIAKDVTKLGYDFRGPHDDEDHWYGVYNAEEKRLFNLHLFLQGAETLMNRLKFRDVLRNNDDLRDEYAKKKIEWANQTNWDKRKYSLSKDEFIQMVLEDGVM